MATRNPLNQRYQGEGPGGQTRKSASSVKPATQAASSVHIKKKPTTAAEKRAAARAREKEAAKKAREKAAKQAEKEKAAKIEAEKLKAADIEAGEIPSDVPVKKSQGPFSFLKKPENEQKKAPVTTLKTAEYLKWRKIYWILIGIGLVAVIASLFITNYVEYGAPVFIVLMVIAYAAIISSFIINLRKMRPLERRNTVASNAKKSPKALKHEQEAREQAAQIEAARKAEKARKKNRQERGKILAPSEPGEEDEKE